jgi:ArsR family transcriptional regulator
VSASPVEGCECGEPTQITLGAKSAERLALRFKALGHPVRLQILSILHHAAGEVCVCEVEAHFSLSQPTISHHLKTLRDTGLVISTQRGLWVYHHINPECIQELSAYLNGID